MRLRAHARNAWSLGERGFSLVELLSVMVVTGIFVGLIMFFTFSYWRYGFLMEADLDTFVSRLNAGDYMREAFSASSGLITQNSIPDNYSQNPDPAIPGNQYWSPIHAVPGSVPVGSNGTTTPLVYFRRHSLNSSGTVIMNGAQPFEDEYILYLNGSTKQLLVRALANPNASGNRLMTSCPPASASTTCPPDKVLIGDLASVDMRYFSRSGNIVDYSSIIDPDTGLYAGPDYPVVDVIEFTLGVTKKPIFQKTNATQNKTIIRVALRNT